MSIRMFPLTIFSLFVTLSLPGVLHLCGISRSCAFSAKVNVIDFESGKFGTGPNNLIDPCGGKAKKPCDCGVGNTMTVVKKGGSHPVRAGNYACYHRLHNCMSNSEVGTKNGIGHHEVIWVGWSLYFPKDGPVWGSIITQFHDRYGSLGGKQRSMCGGRNLGPTSLRGGPGKIEFKIRRAKGNCEDYSVYTVFSKTPRGVWLDFVMQAHFTPENNGFIKLWAYEAGTEPVLRVDHKGPSSHCCPEAGGGPWIKMGQYTGSGGKAGETRINYSDELRWGREKDGVGFKDVAPGGVATVPSGGTPVTTPAEIDFTAPVVRLDFGGTGSGEEWVSGDRYATGGESFTFSSALQSNGTAGEAPAAVYQSVIHCTQEEIGPGFSFDFPDVPDGTYMLRLHATDQFGGRAMDIAAEGTTIAEDFDPQTEAGGAMMPAVIEATVEVADGNGLQLTLSDNNAEAKDVFLSGLEIIRTKGITGIRSSSTELHRRGAPDAEFAIVSLHGRTMRRHAPGRGQTSGMFITIDRHGIPTVRRVIMH